MLMPAIYPDNKCSDISNCWHFNILGLVVRKPAFCICENKDADQLRGYREADQRLSFRYTDSTIPLLPKSEMSSLYPSCVVVEPGLCRKPRRPVFSQRGSFMGRINFMLSLDELERSFICSGPVVIAGI